MRNKLKANADYFPNKELCMAYIEECAKGEAICYIFPQTQPNYLEAYKTVEEIFQHLADVYKDPDKLQNAKKDF
jgi:hypothetical protein